MVRSWSGDRIICAGALDSRQQGVRSLQHSASFVLCGPSRQYRLFSVRLETNRPLEPSFLGWRPCRRFRRRTLGRIAECRDLGTDPSRSNKTWHPRFLRRSAAPTVHVVRLAHAQRICLDRCGWFSGRVRNSLRRRLHFRSRHLRPRGHAAVVIYRCVRVLRRRSYRNPFSSSAVLMRARSNESTTRQTTKRGQSQSRIGWLAYPLLGIAFGIVLTKSEVVSWFRIQEMFRFQSPRMYEIIASALAVAAASVAFIKKVKMKTVSGEPIEIEPKSMGLGVRYAAGGTIFGLGWALVGACPGPLFALVGNGFTVMIVAIGSALAGTWLYGLLRPRLPH